MAFAIILGVVGFLCAISVTVWASIACVRIMQQAPIGWVCKSLLVCACARGFMHYGEHYFNHYIAFRILALLREHIFEQLRKLCPAKLDGKNKGELISVITTDIELLEVFYAHTISPIAIALLTSIIVVAYIWHQSRVLGYIAAIGYTWVGAGIPLVLSKLSRSTGMKMRKELSEINAWFLDNIRGLSEVIQMGCQERQLQLIDRRTEQLNEHNEKLNRDSGTVRAVTDLSVAALVFTLLLVGGYISAYRQISLH